MVMKKASDGDFSLRQGAGKSSRTLRDGFGDGGGIVTFRGFLSTPLRFSRDGEYMGEEAESEATWWPQTHARRGQDSLVSGHLVAPVRLPFWLWLRDGIIRCWVFVPC